MPKVRPNKAVALRGKRPVRLKNAVKKVVPANTKRGNGKRRR